MKRRKSNCTFTTLFTHPTQLCRKIRLLGLTHTKDVKKSGMYINRGNAFVLKQEQFALLNAESKEEISGTRQWPINWCTSPIMKHKITTSLDKNLLLKRLNTQFNESTNQNPQSC